MSTYDGRCIDCTGHVVVAGRVCSRCGVNIRPDLSPPAYGDVPGGPKTVALLSLLARDGPGCHWCGSVERATVDHVIPRQRGGTDDLSNLVISCAPCNEEKGALSAEEFLDLRYWRRLRAMASPTRPLPHPGVD